MYSVIAFDGQVYGPVDVRTLIAWCQQGRIVASTHLVETQTGFAFKAGDMPELSAALMQSQPMGQPVQTGPFHPPSHFPPQNQYGGGPLLPSQSAYGFPSRGGYGAPKSRKIALLLCFLGIHRFYLGHTVSGIAFLVVTLLGLSNLMFFVIAALWGTIDFLRIAGGQMADSQGVIPV